MLCIMRFSLFSFQSIANMNHGKIGPHARNHALVEIRTDREVSKSRLNLEDPIALAIQRKFKLAILKTVQVRVNDYLLLWRIMEKVHFCNYL